MESGQGIVDHAMAVFGRVDVLVNNAGVLRDSSFNRMTEAQWSFVYSIHLRAVFSLCKACWPIMKDQGYGKIVNISSTTGLYGNYGQANYAAMKSALIGFSLTLAKEGEKSGICVNVVAPVAGTSMTKGVMPEDLLQALKPEYVAPLVVCLCSEDCDESGAIFEAGGGFMSRLRWQRTRGVVFPIKRGGTGQRTGEVGFGPEEVLEAMDRISDFENEECDYPESGQDAFEYILPNLQLSKL